MINTLASKTPLLGLLLLFTSQITLVNAIIVSICSSQNTGALSNPTTYSLNSLGYCSDKICVGSAFAITNSQTCWCSDVAPASSVSISDCNYPCPGWPYEFCGSQGGLFSYVQLANASSTAGASTSHPTSTTAKAPVTVVQTIVSTIISNNVVYQTTAIYRTSVILASSSSHSSGSTLSPSVIKETYTVSGAVETRVITASPVSPPSDSAGTYLQEKKGLSGAAIAGVVIGVLVALLLIALLVFCCWRRRQRPDREYDVPVSGQGNMTRGSSVLSKAGLLRHSSTRRGPSTASAIAASLAIGGRPSRLDTDIPEMSKGPSSATSANLERRDSRPLFVDQRLNPNATISQTSIQTLADNHDYSRPLEIRNP